MTTPEARPGLLGRVAAFCHRYAFLVALAAFASAFPSLSYVRDTLVLHTSTTDLLSEELPYRADYEDFIAALPALRDNVAAVVEAPTAAVAEAAAAELTRRMRAESTLFRHVFSHSEDAFFKANALLFLPIEELREATGRLAEAQPFLTSLAEDPGLRGLFGALELAVKGLERDALKGDEAVRVQELLEAVSVSLTAFAHEGEGLFLPWRRLFHDETRSKRAFVIAQPVLDFSRLLPAEEALSRLRTLGEEVAQPYQGRVTLRLSDVAALEQDEIEGALAGGVLAGLLALVLVAFIVVRGLRDGRMAFAVMLNLVMGLVWTATFAAFAVGRLNLLSIAFAVLFIGVGVDFAIQYGLRFRESLGGLRRRSHETAGTAAAGTAAAGMAARGLASPLAQAALAGGGGFLAFLPTGYIALAELGVIAAGGMAVAFLSTFTLLPALLRLGGAGRSAGAARHGKKKGKREEGMEKEEQRSGFPLLAWMVVRYDTRIVALALAAAAGGIASSPLYRFDGDPFNLRDPSSESMEVAEDLLNERLFDAYAVSFLALDSKDAKRRARRLSALAEVEHARTPTAFLPRHVEEKLPLIEDVRVLLAPSLAVSPLPPADDSSRLAAVESLKEAVARARAERLSRRAQDGREKDATDTTFESLARALEALSAGERSGGEDGGLRTLEETLLAGWPELLSDIKASLSPQAHGSVARGDFNLLPQALRARHISKDGRLRVIVRPVGEPRRDFARLERFVDSVRSLEPQATQGPVIMVEGRREVVHAFRQAAGLAVAFVLVLLLLTLRRLSDAAFVFLPLALSVPALMGLSVFIGLPLNFANVIALPLLFTLGVSYGIYILTRWREEGGVGALMMTATPRAVLLSGLTTIGSFGTLAVSSHRGVASMGLMLMLALSLALVASLVVLPALLSRRQRDSGRPSRLRLRIERADDGDDGDSGGGGSNGGDGGGGDERGARR